MKFFNSRIQLSFIFLVAFLAALGSFQQNIFKAAEANFFADFDRFSQILVTGRLIAHDAGVDNQNWKLGSATINGELEQTDNNLNTYQGLIENNQPAQVAFFPYKSQYGLQGSFFLWFHDVFGLDVHGLQFVNAVLFSLVIAYLSILFIRIYDWKYALVFFAVTVTAPWVVAFARNLYWVPFLWFLPAVFASLLYLSKNKTHRLLLGAGVFFAVFLKSLTGYEYLSAITLFACSVFVVAPFFRTEQREHVRNFKMAIVVFGLCVAGFLCALVMHAGMRGDTILHGIVDIFERDVKRRTFGDPAAFDPVFRDSLNASFLDVLQIYWSWLNWTTSLFAGISAYYMSASLTFLGMGALYSVITRRFADLRVLVLVAVLLLCPLSWLVLAKGHSYIHTQLNYVLWYFGFVQALAYAVVMYVWRFCTDLYRLAGVVKGMTLAGKAMVAAACCVVLLGWALYNKQGDSKRDAEFAAAAAKFEVGSGFKVLFSDADELTVFKKKCSASNVDNRFFVHAYPQSPEDKPNLVGGFLNLDFKMIANNNISELFSKYFGACLATVKLPPYSLERLVIGQYSMPEVKIIWGGSVELNDKSYVDQITPFNLTDGNWAGGISTFDTGFFVENTFENRQSLKVGDVLEFAGSGKRKIVKLSYSEQYINVFLEGERLMPEQDGYPKHVFISKN